MTEDDIYDDIKRLYNEDSSAAAVQEGALASGEGGVGVCSGPLSPQGDGSCPCPPLQPAGAS